MAHTAVAKVTKTPAAEAAMRTHTAGAAMKTHTAEVAMLVEAEALAAHAVMLMEPMMVHMALKRLEVMGLVIAMECTALSALARMRSQQETLHRHASTHIHSHTHAEHAHGKQASGGPVTGE